MPKLLNQILTLDAEAENEWIAVIPRSVILDGSYWSGFKWIDESEIFEIIKNHLDFKPRNETLEKDGSFKQIIPYFLIRKGEYYFTSVRKNKGGDKRAHGYRLIGFGGHLRKEDIKGEMKEWLKREFEEEIKAAKITNISYLGIVNDDSDAVSGIGKVHLGLVFVIDVEGDVSINEQEKFEEGEFLIIKTLKDRINEMESWSAIVAREL